MKNIILVGLSLSLVLFSACSSKKVFDPDDTASSWKKYEKIDGNIIDISSSAALLENRKVLTNEKTLNLEVPEAYRLISNTGGWIISGSIDGKLHLQSIEDVEKSKKFELGKTVASAGIKNDLLAVLFADNDMALYNLHSKELLFKEKAGGTLAVDSRISNPYFVGGVVVFPTLDGKVVIVNPQTNKRLRTTIVSSEDDFNNVLYFNIIDQKVIAATAHKILSLDEKETRAKYEIRNVAFNGTDLFLATKQGKVIALTPSLQFKAELKFPFAHFLGLIAKEDKIYVLEKEGYMIVAPSDLSSYKVHEVDFDEGHVFVSEKGFFVNDELISVE